MVRVGNGRITAINARTLPPASFLLDFADLGAGAVSLVPSAPLGVSATYTRATAAIAAITNGDFATAGSGVARSWYSPAGIYLGYMAEGLRTNVCSQCVTYNAVWSAVGTPTFSGATTNLGAVVLDTIGDDSAAALEGYTLAVTFTGDAVKAVGVFVKQGTSTSSVIRLRDGTAAADRLLAAITWTGSVPVVTMTTGTDLTGTPVQQGTSGAYWLKFQTTAVTAASSHQLELYPATDAGLTVGGTGTIQMGFINEEDAAFPSSPILTANATVTRNADVLTYPTAGWFDNTQGTVFFQMSSFTNAGIRVPWQGSNVQGGAYFSTTTLHILDLTTDLVTINPITFSGSTQKKIAMAYGSSTMVAAADGVIGTQGAFDGSLNIGANIGIGTDANGTAVQLFGTMRRWSYLPPRLSNSQITSITTP